MNSSRLRKRKVKDEEEEDYYSEDEFECDDEENPSPNKRKSKKYPGRNGSSKKGDGGHSGRMDNSLGVLTKKFVSLIQSSENKCIDLNDAVEVLVI
jgi:hypothetical protein